MKNKIDWLLVARLFPYVLFALAAASIVALLLSFSVIDYNLKKSTAEVEQVQGLFIFTDSKPVMEYEYLGTVKSSLTLGSSQYTGIRDVLIKKAKKDYPDAEALILSLQSGGTDRCDVIKFKK